jgi:hypothetical protein
MMSAGDDLDQIYEEAARSGLHTPERLERMRKRGVIPATRSGMRERNRVAQNPWWLAAILRTFDRFSLLWSSSTRARW